MSGQASYTVDLTLPTPANDIAYSYDNAGQLLSETIGLPADGDDSTWTYDNLGRRTGTKIGTTWIDAIDYDARGLFANRATTTGGGDIAEARAYDATGALITDTLAVDGGTPTTHQLSWDTTLPVPELLTDVTESGTRNIHHSPFDDPAYTTRSTTGSTAIDVFGRDPLGSITTAHNYNDPNLPTPTTDYVAGNTYTAYGQPQTPTAPGTLSLGYRGELHTGDNIHLRARDYQPTTGTFTTRDPLDGINGTPTITNPYHYADNDPLNKTDPTGLRPGDGVFTWSGCSDLLQVLFEGEMVWAGLEDGSCYITPTGFNPQCLDRGLSGTLCKWRDLRVRDRGSWAGEDRVHEHEADNGGCRACRVGVGAGA